MAAGAALAAAPDGALAHALAYERSAVDDGQWWRLLTAHLVHPTAALAAVDLAGALAGGALLEAANRRRFVLLLLGSALVVGLAVQLDPRVQHYDGASGLASALLAAACLAAALSWRGGPRVLAVTVLIGLLAKLAADAAGVSWWGAAPAPGLRVATTAHVAGTAVGLLAAPLFRTDERRPATQAGGA